MTNLRKACTLLLSLGASQSVALPGYRNRVPNGAAVRCFDGAEDCNREGICEGLGHATCAGGSFPLNPFGVSLAANGHQWTLELCNEDSDGDGLTNGQELGDPCCQWVVGSSPHVSLLNPEFIPSHPGNSLDKHTFDLSAVTCEIDRDEISESVWTPPDAEKEGWYQPGESEMSVTYIMKNNITLPAKVTEYITYGFKVDFSEHVVLHMVGAEAIVGNVEKVHHFLLFGCKDAGDIIENGEELHRLPMEEADCENSEFIWGWAPGVSKTRLPAEAGIRFENGTLNNYLHLQIHYDNPGQEAGDYDMSGVILHFTPDLRTYDAGIFQTGYALGVNIGEIPPLKPSFFKSHICEVDMEAGESVTAFAWWGHAHLLGRAVWNEHYRSCKKIGELGREMAYWFDDQYYGLYEPTEIRNGDAIQTTCVFNSEERTESTWGGIATREEMCYNNIMYYPKDNIKCRTRDFYDGDLLPTDSTSQFVLSHPGPVSGDKPGCEESLSEKPQMNFMPVIVSVIKAQCAQALGDETTKKITDVFLNAGDEDKFSIEGLIQSVFNATCDASQVGGVCPQDCLSLMDGLADCVGTTYGAFLTGSFPTLCSNWVPLEAESE